MVTTKMNSKQINNVKFCILNFIFVTENLPKTSQTIETVSQPSNYQDSTSLIRSLPPAYSDLASFDDEVMDTDNYIVLSNIPYHLNNRFEDIARWLARPVLALTLQWTSALVSISSIAPYTMLTNTSFAKKLANFNFFRANAVFTFKLNGSPFHFGRLIAAWNPTILTNKTVSVGFAQGLLTLPYVLLDPSNSKNVVFKVPFLSTLDTIALNQTYDAAAFTNLGSLYITPLVALANAQSATVEAVSLSVYVHFEDVFVDVSSSNALVPTSSETIHKVPPPTAITQPRHHPIPNPLFTKKEEVKQGVITKFTSSMASTLRILRVVPQIAPFALAGAALMDGMSHIAAYLGFSRPSKPPGVTYVVPKASGPMSSMIAEDTSTVFGSDPQRSVTIDPSVAGFSSVDQMSMAFVKSQWGSIGSFTWTDSQTAGTILQIIPVTPGIVSNQKFNTSYRVVPPVAHLASAFSRWRGGLRYRIEVVASPMMKGRLLLQWNYPGNVATVQTSPDTPMCVIDLAEATKKDITISWANNFLSLPNSLGASSTSNLPTTTVNTYGYAGVPQVNNCNGVLYITVLNELVAAFSPQTVTVLMYSCGDDDLEFLEPLVWHNFNTPLTSSETINAINPDKIPNCRLNPLSYPIPPKATTITFGETVSSVRALIKRYNFFASTSLSTAAQGGAYTDIVLPNTLAPHVSQYACFLEHFLPCYIGYKGSLRWKIFIQLSTFNDTQTTGVGYNESNNPDLDRIAFVTTYPPHIGYNTLSINTAVQIVNSNPNFPVPLSQISGSNVEAIRWDHQAIEVQAPDMSAYLFCPVSSTGYAYYDRAYSITVASVWASLIEYDTSHANAYPQVNIFRAAGEDFSLLGYIGPPAYNLGF
jgi:hypothetical protein